MVGGDHRQRIGGAELRVPAVDETTRHRVDELDFAGIGLREWFGTVVRCVRVDEVDPQQRGPTSVDSLQPFLHANDRLIAAVFLGPCTGLAVGGLEAEDLLLEAAPAGIKRLLKYGVENPRFQTWRHAERLASSSSSLCSCRRLSSPSVSLQFCPHPPPAYAVCAAAAADHVAGVVAGASGFPVGHRGRRPTGGCTQQHPETSESGVRKDRFADKLS